jgi:acetolactate synthase small subunit
MSEFYYKDYDNYFTIFSKHAERIAEMMSHLNYQITEYSLPPVPSQELFRMTLDLLYYVDQSYKADNSIPDKYEVVSFKTKDEMLDSMRSLLKEELDRYLGSSDAANQ